MAEHPAIVALARLFNPHAWACEGLKIDDCDTKSDRHDTLEQARVAYAAVIRDLIAQSQPEEFWFRKIITARAREIGVEI